MPVSYGAKRFGKPAFQVAQVKCLIFVGLALNVLLSLLIWPLGFIHAKGYAIGSFAMLANLIFLAAGRFWGVVGFLGLAVLTYWATQQLPGVSLYLYALGLASPMLVGLIWFRASNDIDSPYRN